MAMSVAGPATLSCGFGARHRPIPEVFVASVVRYHWNADGRDHVFELVRVEGTRGRPCPLGDGGELQPVEVQGFFIGTTPVTQALWTQVVGADSNPAITRGADLPVENVSWDEITRAGGILNCL